MLEFGGLGPAPFCGMLLADMGADVIVLDRSKPEHFLTNPPAAYDFLNRGKTRLEQDLKSEEGQARTRLLIEKADILIEGYRPGVMERLGFGPDECHAVNARLVYGRATGWGQTGPLAQTAGHDLNYISLSGALASISERDGPPVVPLNLIGDFGGGALYLAVGLLAALNWARASGRGGTWWMPRSWTGRSV